MDLFTRKLRGWVAQAYPLDGSGVSGAQALPAYAALGRWGTSSPALDTRLELLVGQLAAEMSGCRWCIEQGSHRWRRELLPSEDLAALRNYQTSPLFSARDRAALELAEVTTRYSRREATAAQAALGRVRAVLSEAEVARVVQITTAEHFYDPATGAIGRDVAHHSLAARTPVVPPARSGHPAGV